MFIEWKCNSFQKNNIYEIPNWSKNTKKLFNIFEHTKN